MTGDAMTAKVALPPGVGQITLDSRRVRPGWMYAALPGTSTHGANFIGQAIAAGAAAILTDPAGKQIAGELPIPVLVSDEPRAALAWLAAELCGHPAREMLMLAVTGTAGKTSTVAMLAAGLAKAGYLTGTIGTLGFFIGSQAVETDRSTVTTPESPDLQSLLARMRAAGAQAVAMEVSSHALAQHRADAVNFAVAGFTNLGRDHLDYHSSVEDYFQTKAKLFTAEHAQAAVVNVDDPFGGVLAEQIARRSQLRLATVAMSAAADYRVEVLNVDAAGRRELLLRTPKGSHEFGLSLLGGFNAKNALLAAAMLDQAGVDLDRALEAMADVYVPGRMQRVELGEGAPYAVVDFAHTPETVQAALTALPPQSRRIAVLGCGGDRDREKRRPMGEAAAQHAAVVVVTDDNPRTEDPAAIRAEVLAGASRAAATSGAEVIDGGGRRAAIAKALALAGPGDWVVVLGRGHETSQLIGTAAVPFSDQAVIQGEWSKVGGGEG